MNICTGIELRFLNNQLSDVQSSKKSKLIFQAAVSSSCQLATSNKTNDDDNASVGGKEKNLKWPKAKWFIQPCASMVFDKRFEIMLEKQGGLRGGGSPPLTWNSIKSPASIWWWPSSVPTSGPFRGFNGKTVLTLSPQTRVPLAPQAFSDWLVREHQAIIVKMRTITCLCRAIVKIAQNSNILDMIKGPCRSIKDPVV